MAAGKEDDRFRMPAEWERHRGTWLAWPHNRSDWPGRFEPIPWVYVEIVRLLSKVERVRIIVGGRGEERKASEALARGGADLRKVDFFRFPTDRSWCRDMGPIFVKGPGRRGKIHVADFRFNAWAKYRNWHRDDRVAAKAAAALGLPLVTPTALAGGRPRRVVLEGGSIDGNGLGTLLTTEECLLSPVQARNPGLSREDLEAVFREYLGVRKVLWLGRGIAGDDTHGHVDDIARFVGPRTVVAAYEESPADPNHAPLAENIARLRSMTDQDGRPLRVVTLPMPRPIVFDGQRLPASYANFYIANGVVLVPTFNDPADREALTILARLFTDRQVVGVHCVDLVWGLGTLHCMTHEEQV
jgi:agmatine deiminase